MHTRTQSVMLVLIAVTPVVMALAALALIGPGESREARRVREFRDVMVEVFPGVAEVTRMATEKAKWQKQYGVSEEEYSKLMDNWEIRTNFQHDGTSPSLAFWEDVKDLTPEEICTQFPSLTDREWFRAELDTSALFDWRNFDLAYSLLEGDSAMLYNLQIQVPIRTVPNKPIAYLRGLLTIYGPEGEELHAEIIDHRPDMSFVDLTFYYCNWRYDDSNPKHRTLRHSNELTATFDVSCATFANGQTSNMVTGADDGS